LNVESTLQDDHQVRLTVEIDDDTFMAAKKKAARRLAKRIKIPGFRPGKAPYQVTLTHIGEESVIEDAVEIIITEKYPEFIKEAEIDPYGPGTLENVNSVDPLVLEITVPISPEVDIGESLSIRRPYTPPEITDMDVEQVLNNMLERQAELEEIERPAEVSDLVTIKLNAYESSEGNGVKREVIPERSVPIVIHSTENVDAEENAKNTSDEWPYPGFSINLIGIGKTQSKEVKHQYSDEDPEPFRNKEITFSYSVENVQSRKLPELDDKFAKNSGGYPDLKSMRSDIFANLDKQNRELYEQSYDDEILDEAVGMSKFKYPPQALENEIDEVIRNLRNRLESQSLDLNIYMKSRNINEQELREETTPVAEERLKKTLYLYEIAKREDIVVDDKTVKSEAKQTLDYLSQTLPYKDARKLSNDSILANLEWNIRADLLARLAMEHFRDICSGKFNDENSSDENGQKAEEKIEEINNNIPEIEVSENGVEE
jgi:trigger factor